MKPLGFSFSDIDTIRKKINCTFLKSIYEYKYVPDYVKKDSYFLVLGKEFRSFLSGKKLLGKFIVIDTVDNLIKLGAELIDCRVSNKTIEQVKEWNIEPCDSIRTKFKRIKIKKNFLNRLIQSRNGDQKVFKHTLQYLFSVYEDECKKKGIKQNKQEIVKALSGASEFDYSNKTLKKIFSMFVSWRETNGGKRTIQAFHDVCLNKTEFDKAVYDNCADPFSLKILVDTWTDKVDFPYFNANVISKRVAKLRKKKVIEKPQIKKCIE